MRVVEDRVVARRVVRLLHECFARREGIFEAVEDLVEFQIPRGVRQLSVEHARFLFFTVVNDHGMKSSRLYAKAKALFRERPDLFEPSEVMTRYGSDGPTRLADELVASLGVRYPRAAARAWLANAGRLAAEFAGDPRRVFRCSGDAREVLACITSFHGYGPKTGAMLLRAVVGLGFAHLLFVDEVLVPVDIHDSRICFFVGALKWEDAAPAKTDYYAHARQVQLLLSSACREEGIPWLDVDRALWLIGSNGCARGGCTECPLASACVSYGSRRPSTGST